MLQLPVLACTFSLSILSMSRKKSRCVSNGTAKVVNFSKLAKFFATFFEKKMPGRSRA
jgi:hypothetical protein